METQARVVELDAAHGIAIVESRRSSACDGCHKNRDGSGCAVCSLVGSDPLIRTRAKNTVGARVGDRVLIATETGRVLRYAALVFLLPLLCGAVGYLLASLCIASPLWQALSALGGFALAFAGLRIWSAKVVARRCDAAIIAVLPSVEDGTKPEENQ